MLAYGDNIKKQIGSESLGQLITEFVLIWIKNDLVKLLNWLKDFHF